MNLVARHHRLHCEQLNRYRIDRKTMVHVCRILTLKINLNLFKVHDIVLSSKTPALMGVCTCIYLRRGLIHFGHGLRQRFYLKARIRFLYIF